MCPAPLTWLLATLLSAPVVAPQPAAPAADKGDSDERALAAAHLETTGPALLDFFRKRTPPGGDRAHLAELVRRLTDQEPAARDRASGELVARGLAAVPLLRQAANNADDGELAGRARQCLEAIEGPSGAALVGSAARVLAARKPAGAAEVLLAYLPFADNDVVVEDIVGALAATCLVEAKPDPALLQALSDPVPVRRARAAEVLCKVGGAAQHVAVRPLLKDPKPTVRLHAALGLLGNQDADGLPVLIDVLGELPPGSRKQAEDYLADLAGEWAPRVPQGEDRVARHLRKELWSAWWRATEGPLLLEEFRSRTLADSEYEQALTLLGRLEDDVPDVRRQAAQELEALGPRVVPLLRREAGRPHPRGATLISRCLVALEENAPPPLPAPAARLLALRRPPGALEALLGFLPFAGNETLELQVSGFVLPLAFREGKPDEALLRALRDKVGVRRAAAGVALCKGGGPEQGALGRALLQDPDPMVRYRVARALADLREKDALPVLIALLADLPVDQAWEVEDYLGAVAGDKAPGETLSSDGGNRARCREAWAGWWGREGAAVDLARLDAERRRSGYLAIESFDPTRRTGRVLELDAAGKVKWQLTDLHYPTDAELLPNGHVLLAEQNLNRVSERDPQGKVVWEKSVPLPIGCQRLRDGGTFIVSRTHVVEYDRDGKEVRNNRRAGESILAARRLRTGQCALFTSQGSYVRLDASGRELKAFRVPYNPGLAFTGAEVLEGDHVLVASYAAGKVYEYNAEGKVVWEAAVFQPGIPHRLPNGHVLLSGNAYSRVLELDRAGKVVAEMKNLPFRPWRIYGR